MSAALPRLSHAQSNGFSLRFHGNGTSDIDRVKIRIDDPTNNDPGPPADVGAADFTLEFWMKAAAAENTAGGVSCGANVNWISGNIVFDRDRFNQDRKFGLSIAGRKVVFGVSGAGTGDLTICGTSTILNEQWHHIAVQRRRSDGKMWLYVDGVLEAQGDGPGGDISYPDDGVPGNFCAGPCTNSDPYLVIGAEKHDAGPTFPSYSGWIDEVRLSNALRYASNFTRPSQPFTPDADTAALYHFDEGSDDTIHDSSGAAGGPSDGIRQFGGSPPGPEWSTDVPPFGAPVAIDFEEVATRLRLPVAITHAGDGSGRLFITQQGGQIVIYDGTSTLKTFLDIGPLVTCCGERGLLSVAFHPQFKSNDFFYVNYTNTSGNTVIARYSVSATDPNVADPGSAVILLTIDQPFSNHNGGQLQFGPDGFLYIGMGDGGAAADPGNRAQDLGTPLGKMLRIDVDTPPPPGDPPYVTPPSNPFFGVPGARDEIWALGFRNPWRFSFDRQTGDLFIADVGQNEWEEVDFQPASSLGGENYGWRLMEGNHCFIPSAGCNTGTPVLTPPILEYNHALGCAITGGYRYRGSRFPKLYGIYFYGDFCSGRLWGVPENTHGNWSSTQLLDTPYSISTFGEDEDGEVYLADYGGGTIYRIIHNPSDLTGQITQLINTNRKDKDTLKFTLAIQNAGSGPVRGDFVVRFFVSADQTLDGSLPLFTKTVKSKKLFPGGVVLISGKATIPSPSRGKYLIAVIDDGNAIDESDEGNNIAVQLIP